MLVVNLGLYFVSVSLPLSDSSPSGLILWLFVLTIFIHGISK